MTTFAESLPNTSGGITDDSGEPAGYQTPTLLSQTGFSSPDRLVDGDTNSGSLGERATFASANGRSVDGLRLYVGTNDESVTIRNGSGEQIAQGSAPSGTWTEFVFPYASTVEVVFDDGAGDFREVELHEILPIEHTHDL